MQNGEEKHGRIVSTRVPLSDYVNLLEEAQERGLKLSELLILKIFSKKTGNQIEPTRSNEHEVGSLDCPKVYNDFLGEEVSEDLDDFINNRLPGIKNNSFSRGVVLTQEHLTRELNAKVLEIKELEKQKSPKTVNGLKKLIREFCDHTFKNRQENLEWRQDVMKFISELDDLEEE